jgi:hypothetical protein
MKKSVLIPLLLTMLVASLKSKANDVKYEEAMQKNIQAVYSAATIEELQATVNAFERIANAEKNKWEPLYYSAFGYIMMSTRETVAATKDSYLDRALECVHRAQAIAGDESEIAAIEGFVYMMQVSVDPASRGPKLMGLAVQQFQRALKLNPENPRALALLAQMQYGAAQFFGSDTTEACSTNDASLAKFAGFKAQSVLAPQWGKSMAEEMKQNCSK